MGPGDLPCTSWQNGPKTSIGLISFFPDKVAVIDFALYCQRHLNALTSIRGPGCGYLRISERNIEPPSLYRKPWPRPYLPLHRQLSRNAGDHSHSPGAKIGGRSALRLLQYRANYEKSWGPAYAWEMDPALIKTIQLVRCVPIFPWVALQSAAVRTMNIASACFAPGADQRNGCLSAKALRRNTLQATDDGQEDQSALFQQRRLSRRHIQNAIR